MDLSKELIETVTWLLERGDEGEAPAPAHAPSHRREPAEMLGLARLDYRFA